MKLYKRFREYIYNEDIDFQKRLFLVGNVIAEIAVLLVFIADLMLKENKVEIVVLGITLIVAPFLTLYGVKKDKADFASLATAFGIVLIVMPVTFFFGGGLDGGSVIWFSFAFLYIGLMLTGAIRNALLTLLFIIPMLEFYIAFYYPDIISGHTKEMQYMDTLISVMWVGVVVYIMVWFQNRLYKSQNRQAREDAKKVEELNRSQNRFFSNMSHEIRTPINTIIGLNEMILREDVSDEVAEDAANIQAASKMLLHLINDILDMSKLESGQMVLTNTEYNPGDMLSDLVGMLWIRAKDKGLEFHINVAPDIPSGLYGDEVRIKQVLINIVNNAIKYTSEGSVTLSIQCQKRDDDMANVVYSVTDTGMGIKKEDIPYLFTAFKRVDEQTNRHIEGTGLGLSIVKQLVDKMGGKITVNSVYTKGSTFVIEIPQKVINRNHIGELNIEERHSVKKRREYRKRFEAPDARVLVVDDNASNLLVVSKLLRDTKVMIDCAGSGEEALKKTLENTYNVIFMDHLMPEMDGIECHRLIRTQTGGLNRNTKVVALTANAGSDNKRLYEKEGFNGYLVKPVTGDALEGELYRLLPKDIIISIGDNSEIIEETMSWMDSHEKKLPIRITTESIADLPAEVISKYGITTIAHRVYTDNGVFRDGQEIETKGLLNYMVDRTHKVETEAPGIEEHEAFFASELEEANNIIHIVLSSEVTKSACNDAMEAARAFDNVTVIDSGHLSSGQGLMVIEACRLAEDGLSPAEIEKRLNRMRDKIHTSFIVDSLDFLARSNQVSQKIANLLSSLMARPTLVMKKGKMGVGRLYFGTQESAWRRYIDSCLAYPDRIDRRILFVTYVGLNKRDTDAIRVYIEKKASFDRIYFMKASPVIAVNCGPGTFGLLYVEK